MRGLRSKTLVAENCLRTGQRGRAPKGHIGLQDYGRAIEYRNIKLRPIAKKK